MPDKHYHVWTFNCGLPDGVRPSGAVWGAGVCDDLV